MKVYTKREVAEIITRPLVFETDQIKETVIEKLSKMSSVKLIKYFRKYTGLNMKKLNDKFIVNNIKLTCCLDN